MLAEIRELAELRLRRHWTYDQLARAMHLTRATVYRILTTPNPQVHETTLFKIREFLDSQRQERAEATA